jgi:hypothetical protein
MAVADQEDPRNLFTMLLVFEAWSELMKDTNKLTPLLRRDDLTCPLPRREFHGFINKYDDID